MLCNILLSKYSNEICNLRIPLGDIHDEIKGISKEWKIWRGKINVVLCEIVREFVGYSNSGVVSHLFI